MIQKRTIGIVGAGHVGAAAAYAIFMAGLAGDIILVDKDQRKAEGEAMDLMHGQAFAGSVEVLAGGYPDLASAQVVVITAGAASRPGESRLALLSRNATVFGEIVSQLDHFCPEAILIVASNPVDILTYIAQLSSRRDPRRILGTGTMLDTARFRALLGRYYGVDPRSVHAYILGEHGDSEVPVWSTARIGGLPVGESEILGKPFDKRAMAALFDSVRQAAYEIIERKGYTSTAIGLSIARLVEAILNDQRSALPVSRMLDGEYGIRSVCLSLPSIIGIHGLEATLLPALSSLELDGLMRSAAILKKSMAELDLGSRLK